jgi:hypothetical protein
MEFKNNQFIIIFLTDIEESFNLGDFLSYGI